MLLWRSENWMLFWDEVKHVFVWLEDMYLIICSLYTPRSHPFYLSPPHWHKHLGRVRTDPTETCLYSVSLLGWFPTICFLQLLKCQHQHMWGTVRKSDSRHRSGYCMAVPSSLAVAFPHQYQLSTVVEPHVKHQAERLHYMASGLSGKHG